MMTLSATVEDQNPWWRDVTPAVIARHPVRRDLQSEVERRVLDQSSRRATLLIGPRQVGKTTILYQVIADLLGRGWPAANILYFDFSDDRLTEEVSPREIIRLASPALDSRRPRLLLLDELSLAPRWDRWLKQAVDHGEWRIVGTDSAASLLRHGGQESGQGRWDELFVEGLTFTEFVRIHQRTTDPDEVERSAQGLLERYLERGGFPEHIETESRNQVRERVRQDVTDRAIRRDLAGRVNDPGRVTDLFVYLVQESGGLFNAANRSRDLDGVDARTIRKWVELLESTFLLRRLPKFGAQPARRLSRGANPKLYAADPGIVSAFATERLESDEVRARLFEAACYLHLRYRARDSGAELAYFRAGGSEVDFVWTGASAGVDICIEVSVARDPRKKIAQLRSVRRRFKADRWILVHGGRDLGAHDDIVLVPIADFLLDTGGFLEGDRP